jgi:hypothetical protein
LATLQTYKGEIAGSPEGVTFVHETIARTKVFIEVNLYKCERNVFDGALSLLRFLATEGDASLKVRHSEFDDVGNNL